jgi:hypothetical protein
MRRSKEEIRDYKLTQLLPKLCFMDIEAADGGPEAWPIEIGFAVISPEPDEDGNILNVESTALLIKPHEDWDETIWSSHAQAVHNIERHELEDGTPATEVADFVLKLAGIEGIVFVSDSPRNDQAWLDNLLELREARGQVTINSLWSELQPCLDQDTIANMKSWMKQNRSEHRADSDAARLAHALIKSRFDCNVAMENEEELLSDPA